jgi:hypothetical protein
MFCAPGLSFGGTEGLGLRFHALHYQTHFHRYRGRRVPLSCFALLDSFSTVSMTSGPILMFCALGPVFVSVELVGPRFHVLRSRTYFRRYRGRWVRFSCFALPYPFSAVSSVSGPVFMFYAPKPIFSGIDGVGYHFHVLRSRTRFGGTEGDGFCFHVLRSRTRFRRYRWRRVLFSCFALPDSFSTVPRALDPVFMFCAPGSVFGGSEGVVSRFHVLRSRTRFWRYRQRRVPFSCFAVTDPFSAVSRESVPVFMFRAHEPVFNGTEGVGSHFHVLRSRTRFLRYRGHWVLFSYFAPGPVSAIPMASGTVFIFCALGPVFDGIDGVWSSFHVLRSRSDFRRYRVRRVPFSCFALPDPFSAVPTASGPVFKFCAPGLFFAVPSASGPVFMFCVPRPILGGSEGVGSHFHVLRSWTHFRRFRGIGSRCHVFRSQIHIQRNRRRQVPFSCFVLPDPFLAVATASGPVFMYCAPGPVFGRIEASGPVIKFCAPGPFSAVPTTSGPVFMFCAP